MICGSQENDFRSRIIKIISVFHLSLASGQIVKGNLCQKSYYIYITALHLPALYSFVNLSLLDGDSLKKEIVSSAATNIYTLQVLLNV
jgi:hypothetical protein